MNETCHNTQSLLPWLVTGSLSSAETVTAFDHVRTCPSCQQELAFLVSAQQAAEQAWSPAPSPEFEAGLWAQMTEELADYDEVTPQQEGWLSLVTDTIRRGLSPFSFVYDTLGYAFRIVTGRIRHVFNG